MTKALVAPAMPLGVKFDSDLTLIENAQAAWQGRVELSRAQSERSARILARRVFRTEEIEFEYHPLDPETPRFTIEGELVAFSENGKFALVELCSGCGNDWRLGSFGDLAGLGRAIAVRDDDTEFVCRDCMIEGKVRKARKR